MYYRICDNYFFDSQSDSRSDIYRRFEFQFSNLFNSGEIAINNDDFNKMYIPDPEFESKIQSFLLSINSAAQFCVGYTGIGKTTSIRHCLNLGISSVPTLTTSSKLTENKRMVIFPTFLDNYVPTAEEHFNLSSRISAVCTAMEKEHPELLETYKTFDGLKAFYSFIQNHTPYILETAENIMDLARTSEEDYIIKRLNNAMKHFPLEISACKLKYYIFKKYDIYDRLVIILDDVETMPEMFQERIIMEYFHLFESMQNTDYPQDLNYRVNLLISLRSHTYRIISSGMRGRILEAYPFEVITKNHPVDLESLFKNRFDHYTNMKFKTIGNPESWKMSYEKLMLINQAFDGQYKDMIINLCFMNIRVALAEYAKVFANRFWIQGDQIKSSTFTISSKDFNINNVTVIRAIGCGNSKVFTGEYNSIIPNFFLTTRDEDYSIQCLLVMQYFCRKMQIFTNGSMEYGLDAEELHNVYTEWKYVLDEVRVKQLDLALHYLFECKILRKSIMDFDDYQTLDTPKSITETSRLYISPRGIELMNMLKRNSILLEMLRECSWRDYNEATNGYSQECSYDLIRNKQQNKLFIDLLEYVESLRQIEEEFFFSSKSINLHEYRNLFGDTLAVEGLISGIENSHRYSSEIYDPVIAKKYYQLKEQINDSKKILSGE